MHAITLICIPRLYTFDNQLQKITNLRFLVDQILKKFVYHYYSIKQQIDNLYG